jgi:hypothetical protein
MEPERIDYLKPFPSFDEIRIVSGKYSLEIYSVYAVRCFFSTPLLSAFLS